MISDVCPYVQLLEGKGKMGQRDKVLQELGLSALDATVEVPQLGAEEPIRRSLQEVLEHGSTTHARAAQQAVHTVTVKLRDKLAGCSMVRRRAGLRLMLAFRSGFRSAPFGPDDHITPVKHALRKTGSLQLKRLMT